MTSLRRGYFETVPPSSALLQEDLVEATRAGLQGARDASRTGSHRTQVEHVLVARAATVELVGAARDLVGHRSAVRDGRSDQREARDLAGEEQTLRARGLEFRRERRDVATLFEIA